MGPDTGGALRDGCLVAIVLVFASFGIVQFLQILCQHIAWH